MPQSIPQSTEQPHREDLSGCKRQWFWDWLALSHMLLQYFHTLDRSTLPGSGFRYSVGTSSAPPFLFLLISFLLTPAYHKPLQWGRSRKGSPNKELLVCLQVLNRGHSLPSSYAGGTLPHARWANVLPVLSSWVGFEAHISLSRNLPSCIFYWLHLSLFQISFYFPFLNAKEKMEFEKGSSISPRVWHMPSDRKWA